MTTFLFVLFTIPFFISAPFYTANIPQVVRFVNNNLLEFSDFIRLKRLKRAIHFLFIDGKDYVLHKGESIVMPAGHPRRFRRRTIQNASRRRFLKNKRFIKKALVFASAFLICFCRLSGIQPVEHFGHRERRIDVRRDVIIVIAVFKQCERVKPTVAVIVLFTVRNGVISPGRSAVENGRVEEC